MITKIGLYRDLRKKRPWVVRWFGEYDPNTGKQRRYSKSFKLRRDAEAFQSQRIVAFTKGQQRDKPEEFTLKDFCEEWLKTRKPDLKTGSLKLYSDTIRRLYDFFGSSFLLSKLTPRNTAKFVAELKPMNAKNSEQLSDWTRHRVIRNCRTIFQYAIVWQLIRLNPFSGVKMPKLVTTRWHYVRPYEYCRLQKVSPSLRCKAGYALAFTAGLRFGELFNLTWADIDFEQGEVKIQNRTSTATIPPFSVKDYEARSIPLPKHTLDILTELHAGAPEGVSYVLLDKRRYDRVLSRWRKYDRQKLPWQNQYMANNVLREFKRHVRKSEIKPNGTLSVHTLRKSCIQNWANELPINVTKELAGHSSISTTQKYYLQVDEYHRAKAAAVIDTLLAKANKNEEKAEITDAGMTPTINKGQYRDRGQF